MDQIDLDLTLMDSAQVFHWHKTEEGEFVAVVNGGILTGDKRDIFARDYFDLDRDYASLINEASGFDMAVKAIQLMPGLRVLNQPTWEALIAFILSANNNVKRIRNLVLALCQKYSDAYTYKGVKYYGFPEAKTLAALDPLVLKTQVTCGYRAEYLVETSKMVLQGFDLGSIKDMPVEQARKELMKLKGVGPKVADCVLLFGCRHTDAFPVDVWVSRLMENWFGVTGTREHMCDEARRLLGPNCGLIQQYLFHAARTGLIEL